MKNKKLKQVSLDWLNVYRVIPSRFPPINFFENFVDPELMDDLFELEGMTNERLREEVNLNLVAKEDRVSGPGATPVMAAFTHKSVFRPTRFSDGSYGVYYAAKELETAIIETVFHREKFMRETSEAATKLQMRVYISKICKPLCDLRTADYKALHQPDDYSVSQEFALALKQSENPWGLVYNSVRHIGGECIAAFRPPAISIPRQSEHLCYAWDGSKIDKIYRYSEIDILR